VWSDIIISQVIVNCPPSSKCQEKSVSFSELKGEYRNLVHLRQTLDLYISKSNLKNVSWEVFEENNYKFLKIDFAFIPILAKVALQKSSPQIEEIFFQQFNLKEGQIFREELLQKNKVQLESAFRQKGWSDVAVNFIQAGTDEQVDLKVAVVLGKRKRLDDVIVICDSFQAKYFAEKKFQALKGAPFDFNHFRYLGEELERELFQYGFYLATVDVVAEEKNKKRQLIIEVKDTEKWIFDVRSGFKDIKKEWIVVLKEMMNRYKRVIDESMLRVSLNEILVKKGYLKPTIKLTLSRFKNKYNDWMFKADVQISEGERTRVHEVKFIGNAHFSNKSLLRFWNQQAGELAEAGFFDEESQNQFSDWLLNEYVKEGFVRAKVSKPKIQKSEGEQTRVEVLYQINEGTRSFVDEIHFTGLNENEESRYKDLFKLKIGKPFNPQFVQQDIDLMIKDIQEQGFYYAELSNKESQDLVTYGKDKASVNLNFYITKGKKLNFKKTVILGNDRTKKKVIERKVFFKPLETITPDKIKQLESSLNATGLFNTVRVKPILHKGLTSETEVLIDVTERDYGVLELAPGFRTDLGFKVSGTLAYTNLWGTARSFALNSQVNRRVDFQTFDKERRKKAQHFNEYSIGTIFNQPDVFELYTDHTLGLNYQRRRFFSFDADIARISNTLSKELSSYFSVDLRHQYEYIKQYEATNEQDNGSFKIGSLTPSLTFDFRNTPNNPTKGTYFNLSCEFANPFFLSQQNQDLTINYYKLISRNRFYIPHSRGTLAISLVGGVQKNLADNLLRDQSGAPVTENGLPLTEGYIPNIKLFRLTGIDIVRGFTDEEINRVSNGQDIGENRVQSIAYMANMKVEPRFFVSDNIMVGAFWDAGRLYVDKFDLGDLRQSVGVTFKIVTGLGTFDIDYGHKLLRKRLSDGSVEDPGRIHVSIGFF
jgi:outer membrane protein insertion porin family